MGWTRKPTPTSETARLRSNVFKGFGNDGVFLERLMYRVIMFNTMGEEDINSFSCWIRRQIVLQKFLRKCFFGCRTNRTDSHRQYVPPPFRQSVSIICKEFIITVLKMLSVSEWDKRHDRTIFRGSWIVPLLLPILCMHSHGRSVLYANTHVRTWEIGKIFLKVFWVSTWLDFVNVLCRFFRFCLSAIQHRFLIHLKHKSLN